ncbi:MAG: alpha/beta hydrolase [Frankiales bacterium]|nr:alpha/beta hydrolase [Frankiales bacterium]
MPRLVIATAVGPAWADLDRVAGPGLLVIGHGAGGSVDAPDLIAVRDACLDAGISVARVTQPYRVAGKKAPPTAATLDTAWADVVRSLGRRKNLKELAFAFGGRSAGARVACRAAARSTVRPAPVAVVALAFPVHPPGRPERSRMEELNAVPMPTLVVQGLSDPFGLPVRAPGRTVAAVPGDHSLKASAAKVGELVADWLRQTFAALAVPD